MYFVDQNKIENTLSYFEAELRLFQSQSAWKSALEKKALERICQMLIECVLDIGNDIIDGFIMRDPGSYHDIMDILIDENVLDQTEGENLKQLITYRKALVQDYLNVNHEELKKALEIYIESLKNFPNRVRTYLNSELGPVTAFKPH
ncbi:DUF86 domain-containing protein [Bacillus sp. CLL-7-23]|uniref:DUF86 domain-containing protein n=1 Tax=Bacillus changyiensis TaxID=3004103 RepID=A0ABT4X5H3_9BACI|nr:DUF86 domain-containing protein [Bacillus changyiensis]MDA7027545.1 DUF86 domain-containing protein [Bacillus changyiensis]